MWIHTFHLDSWGALYKKSGNKESAGHSKLKLPCERTSLKSLKQQKGMKWPHNIYIACSNNKEH